MTEEAKKREFELRFKGLTDKPLVVAKNDGYLKYPNEIVHVIEKSSYTKAVEALKEWHKFEKEQIQKEGPYVGKRINDLIKLTENTLKELGELT